MDALFHEPRHPYTRLLFAATPDLLGDGLPVSIPGAPPRLDRPIEGCPFRARCDRAFARCVDDDLFCARSHRRTAPLSSERRGCGGRAFSSNGADALLDVEISSSLIRSPVAWPGPCFGGRSGGCWPWMASLSVSIVVSSWRSSANRVAARRRPPRRCSVWSRQPPGASPLTVATSPSSPTARCDRSGGACRSSIRIPTNHSIHG